MKSDCDIRFADRFSIGQIKELQLELLVGVVSMGRCDSSMKLYDVSGNGDFKKYCGGKRVNFVNP